MLADPAPGAELAPLTPIRLTFSQTVSSVLGSDHPRLSLHQHGRWVHTDSHTLVFQPSGDGAPFAADETLRFPKPVRVLGGTTWHIAPASFLRLQQLLAQEGYLPVTWSPAAGDVRSRTAPSSLPRQPPPTGTFSSRYKNTPPELTALWTPGEPNTITRGAMIMFQHDHGLTVDAIAGRAVARRDRDAISGRQRAGGYSYVYVTGTCRSSSPSGTAATSSSPRPATPACPPRRRRSAPGRCSSTSRSAA